MPKNNRGNRRSNNNTPAGNNQYSSGWMDSARERPVAAAGLAAAAVGASVFLWSRRSQISEQLSNISDQIGEWGEAMNARGSEEVEMAGGESSYSSGSDGSQFGAGGGTASSVGETPNAPSTPGAASPTNFAGDRSGKSGRMAN